MSMMCFFSDSHSAYPISMLVRRTAGVGDDQHGWAADGLSASRWHGGSGLAIDQRDWLEPRQPGLVGEGFVFKELVSNQRMACSKAAV